jgi:hypothetical protein
VASGLRGCQQNSVFHCITNFASSYPQIRDGDWGAGTLLLTLLRLHTEAVAIAGGKNK